VTVPASIHDGKAISELLAAHDFGERLEQVLVDRGVNTKQAAAIAKREKVKVERVGWDTPSATFRPIRHAWRVEVAHGVLGRSRRLAKCFENTRTSATAWLLISCVGMNLAGVS